MKIKYFILTIAVILIGVFMSFGVYAQESDFPIQIVRAECPDGRLDIYLKSTKNFETNPVFVADLKDNQGNTLNYFVCNDIVVEEYASGFGFYIDVSQEKAIQDKLVDSIEIYVFEDISLLVPACEPYKVNKEYVTYTLYDLSTLQDIKAGQNFSQYISHTHLGDNTSYNLTIEVLPELSAGTVSQLEGRLFIKKDSDGSSTYVSCPKYMKEEFSIDAVNTSHTFVLDDLISGDTVGTAYNYSLLNKTNYTITVYYVGLTQVGGYAD